MKNALVAIVLVGLCAASAAAITQGYTESNETKTFSSGLLAGKLTDLQKGKPVSAADLQSAAGDTQALPENGEVTLNPIYTTTEHERPLSGSPRDTTTTKNVVVHLKLKDGKIVGMSAVETVTYSEKGEMGPAYGVSQTSWSFGDPDFVKKYASSTTTMNGGSKTIPSETTKKKTTLNVTPSALQEQKCAS